jgi:hypothetical protein
MGIHGLEIDPKCQRQIEKLRDRERKLKDEASDIENQIARIQAGQSPIKPGYLIEWESGKHLRRGRVISVAFRWRSDFEYRCHLLRKDGTVIGYATVTTDKCPTIVSRKKTGAKHA